MGDRNQVLHARMQELLLILAEQGIRFRAREQESWSERVEKLVGSRIEQPWRIEELAQQLHTSTSTLQRQLRKEQQSPSEIIKETRMKHAIALLQTTRLQVAEIASRCGYPSHSRFSEVFKQRFGYPPSLLRPSDAKQIENDRI